MTAPWFAQMKLLWLGFSRPQRVALVGLGLTSILTILGLAYWFSRPDYTTLFAQLDPSDAGAIVQQLKAQKIPYQLADNGSRILVPSRVVHETRLRLASLGLPTQGVVGFEIFDRGSVGMTDFVQRLNYQRALQGELARTIAHLQGVSQARVHLALPQPSLFTERERPATASVVVTLKPGARLSPEQIQGIVHLVSSSVEGLSPEGVTVLDQQGKLLSRRSEPGPSSLSSAQLEYQRAVEAELERRVQSLLDGVLGVNQAQVRVAAQLDFESVERTEERFDPNAVVRSEQRTTEQTESSTREAPAAAGAASNAEAEEPEGPSPMTQTRSARETEAVTYEVGRTVERRVSPPGAVKRLSVAVVLAGPSEATGGEGGRQGAVPRSPEELEQIKALVMSAVGFSSARGDEVTVVELPFDKTALEKGGVEASGEGRPFWADLVKPAGFMAGLLLVLLLLVRPLLKLLRGTVSYPAVQGEVLEAALRGREAARELKSAATPLGLPGPGGSEPEQKELEQQEALKQQLVELTRRNPERAVSVVRNWMASRSG